MTLQEWLRNTGASSWNKYLDRWLDLEVTREFHGSEFEDEEWDDYMKLVNSYFPNHRHVFSFIILSNGWAVGWNENPSHGWSFPKSVKKYE